MKYWWTLVLVSLAALIFSAGYLIPLDPTSREIVLHASFNNWDTSKMNEELASLSAESLVSSAISSHRISDLSNLVPLPLGDSARRLYVASENAILKLREKQVVLDCLAALKREVSEGDLAILQELEITVRSRAPGEDR